MSSSIQLIVGLANPGKEYADTRHNAGAWFVEKIAQSASVPLRFEAKYHGFHGVLHLQDHACHLLIPTTFMNLSGRAVRSLMSYHKLLPSNILIAHDDIDLAVGSIKLKLDGGDGGHNGLKDIIRHLNSKQFYRLRIGVGRPTHASEVVDYVLDAPSKADRKEINTALFKAHEVMPLVMQGEMQKAMHKLHT